MILRDEAQIVYRSPGGRCWHLAGYPGQGQEGVLMGEGPTGWDAAPTSLLFQQGARQIGATYTGHITDRRDLSLEVSITGSTPFEFTTRRDQWLTGLAFGETGWLHAWTPRSGWRSLRVRLREQPTGFVAKNPARAKWDKLMVPLVAEEPYWEGIRETAFWRNKSGLGRGTVHVRNPGHVPADPAFTLIGPGTPYIQDGPGGPMVELPRMQPGEVWLVDTNKRRRTIRSSTGENLWPRMRGRKFRASYPPRSSTPITVRFDAATTASQVLAVTIPRFEGWQ